MLLFLHIVVIYYDITRLLRLRCRRPKLTSAVLNGDTTRAMARDCRRMAVTKDADPLQGDRIQNWPALKGLVVKKNSMKRLNKDKTMRIQWGRCERYICNHMISVGRFTM